MDKKKLNDFIKSLQEVAAELDFTEEKEEKEEKNKLNELDYDNNANSEVESVQDDIAVLKSATSQNGYNLNGDKADHSVVQLSGSDYISCETFVYMEDGTENYEDMLEVCYDYNSDDESQARVNIKMPPMETDKLLRSLVLKLTAKSGAKGHVNINGKIYAACTKDYYIDITNLINGNKEMRVSLEGKLLNNESKSNIDFYTSGSNAPQLFLYYENITDYTELHSFKNFNLCNKITSQFDLYKRKEYMLFSDMSSLTSFLGQNITHVYLGDLTDSGMGKGFSLNLYEMLIDDGVNKVYKDGLGNSYMVYDNKAKGMKYYTTDNVPENVSKLSRYTYIKNEYNNSQKEALLPTQWLISDGVIRGFNEKGLLVQLCNTYDYCVQISYNDFKQVEDVSNYYKNELLIGFSFVYSYGRLKYIKNSATNKKIQYTYDDDYLTQMEFPSGLSFYLSYSDGRLTKITSSDGYIYEIGYNGAYTLSARSSLSQVPNGATNTSLNKILSWEVKYDKVDGTDDDVAIITDINNNKEYYTFSSEGAINAYYKQQNNLIVSAERYELKPKQNKKTYKANKDILYKSSWSDFKKKFDYREVMYEEYDDNGYLVRLNIYNKDISDNMTVEYDTVFTNNSDGLCTKSVTTISYQSDEDWTFYNYIEEYEYNTQCKPVKKTSYVKEDIANRGKNIETYVYDNYGNNHITTKYNSLSVNSSNVIESKIVSTTVFDKYGRKIRDYNQTGTYAIKYSYKEYTSVLSSIEYPDGRIISYTYDDNDNLTEISTTCNGNVITNKITRQSDSIIALSGGNDEIGFTYDKERQLSQVSFGSNSKYQTLDTSVVRNSDGVTLPNKTSKVLNANNELVVNQVNNQSNEEKKYYVSSAGINTDYSSNLEVYSKYDNKGQLVSYEDKLANTTSTYTYNDFSQIKKYVIKQNNTLTYSEEYVYDDYGCVQNVIKKFGSEKFSTKTFAYDNTYDRRLTYVGEGGIECYLYYDNEGRNNSKIVYGEGVKLYESKTYYLSKNSVTTQLSSKIAYTFTNGGNSSISYEYDANENITRIYDGKYNTYYTYDSLNRLVREDNEYFNTSKYYIYDDMGNLLGYKSAPKYTTATDVTSTMLSQTNYTYNSGKIVKDADGKSIAYDAVGNPTLYRGLSATWKNCKLTKLGNTTFEYNTNGRRFKKNSIEYYYDVMGKLVKSSDGLSYYYDNNKLLGFSYCGKTYIYVTDIQDNIIKILDSDGNIVVNYYYDAWGNFKVNGDSTIANINPFRYRGYFYDIETGLYYLNTRYYDPQIGRFISIDEISCASPETINGLNLYAYCYNNPIKYVDINGRTPIDFGLMGELLDYMSSIPFACLAGLAQNAGRTDVFNVINKVAGKAGKASSALGTGLIFLQAGFTIYDEVNSGVSIGRAISDAAYDVILSLVEIKIAACIVAAFSLTGVVASVATFGVGLAIVGGIYLLNKYCPQVEQVLKDAFYCVASEVVEGVVTICTDLNNALNVVGDYLNDWFKSVVGWVHQWI